MKNTLSLALALSLIAGTGSAFAQGRDDHARNTPPMARQHDNGRDNHRAMPGMNMRGPAHPDWRQGGRIARDDWRRGMHVDYRAHHLRRPPRGYEWREVDGNYVLAAAATGLIASIILANH